MTFIDRMKQHYYAHQEQNIHALKFTIAFSIAYFLTKILDDPNSVWILITVSVIMTAQPVVGQQMQKGMMRIVGTTIGAFIGFLAFHLLANTVWLFVLVILIAFVVARFAARSSADFSYAAVLCMVTFSLLALTPKTDLHFALMRVKDISIGVVISLLISKFVFPLTSRRALLFEAQRNLIRLRELIDRVYIQQLPRREDQETRDCETLIIKGLIKERAILKVMRFESVKSSRFQSEYNQLIRYFRALFHYMVFIDVAICEIAESESKLAKKVRQDLGAVFQPMIMLINELALKKIDDEAGTKNQALFLLSGQMQQYGYENPKFQAQFGAICFALGRIPLCWQLVVENWNLLVINH